MRIGSCIGYAAATILTLGISQAIGSLGLLCTAIKKIYDTCMIKHYANKLAGCTTEAQSRFYQRKVEHYQRRNIDNVNYAKAFSLSLISLSLNYYTGYLGKTFEACMRDLFSVTSSTRKLARRFAYLKSGETENHSKTLWPCEKWRCGDVLMGAERVTLETAELEKCIIDGIWIPSTEEKAPTVILYHGNGMVCDEMKGFATWFYSRDINVLMVTMRGYPESSPEKPTTELSSYHTGKAAVDYVKKRTGCSHDRILAYGLSIGSTIAVSNGEKYDGLHVITDQGFTNVKDVALNKTPEWLKLVVSAAIDVSFPLRSDPYFKTDRLDNVEKITRVSGRYLALYASEDQLMTRKYGDNLSHLLINAYNRSHSKTPARLVKIVGGHCAFFPEDKEAEEQVEKFLKEINFVPNY